MTDNEIIKALEICINNEELSCKDKNCPCFKLCAKDIDALEKQTLDLINRQKAEIEGLKAPKFLVEYKPLTDKEMYEKMKNAHLGIITVGEPTIKRIDEEGIKSEAIKEFAERLKEHTTTAIFGQGKYSYEIVTEQSIDNLVKEMTEQKE